jgi:NAD(P)-dependent dehydrogenase (short-subunit alcohol dehydrogenase family)
VALVARRRELLEEVAAEAGGETLVVPADVTKALDVEAAVEAAVAGFGALDVVVNNAGILIPGRVEDMAPADLDAMLRVNLFGALHVLQASLRHMRAQGAGRLVNVASLAGRRGISPLGGYSATKFALVGLTEALREELVGTGVTASLVLPGVVETPMVEHVTHDEEFLDFWPQELNMPPSWVVWAVFAAARFGLAEISVPPGAATIEKLAALAPGVSDALVRWTQAASHWVARRLHPGS